MAAKVALDLDIFLVLSETTSSVTCRELASRKGASVQLVGRSQVFSY
jgi:hypothetical protein